MTDGEDAFPDAIEREKFAVLTIETLAIAPGCPEVVGERRGWSPSSHIEQLNR